MRILNDAVTSPSSTQGLSQRDKISYGVSALGRVGFSRDQALGAIGSLMGESGRSMKTTAHNPNDPNGGSIGIGQWHSDRRTALENFAKTSKYGLYDFRTQMDFVAHELTTTQKNVAEKMKAATSRKQASQVWTQQYERPKKEFEFLGKRAANADYAHSVLGQIKGPQDAADAAHVLDGFGSLTGATDEMATSYVDPQVSTADRDAKAAANKRSGPFGAVMTAVDDISSQFSGRTAEQAAAARGGVVNHTVDHLGDLGRRIGSDVFGMSFSNPDGTPNEKAGAKADSGFFGETSMGAMMGSVVGGVFGGPVGAIVGGLAGQGISRALDKMSTANQDVADAEVTQGSAGGVGRAIDGFFGGLGGMFASDEKKAADAQATANRQAEQAARESSYPSAPNGGRGAGSGGEGGYGSLNAAGRAAYASSGQVRSAVDSKSPGLW